MTMQGNNYIIIDALDECTNDRTFLIDLITQVAPTGKCLKWIVSSRNWPRVEERLRDASQLFTVDLELNYKSVSRAVEIHIQDRVSNLAKRKRYDQKTYDMVFDHLV